MKRTVTTLLAVSTAALGTAVLPASSAQAADAPLPCPRVIGVCTWSGPEGTGELQLHFTSEPLAQPFQSAQNQTPVPWCAYEFPYFGGQRVQLEPWQTERVLGFTATSLTEGPCLL